MLTPERGASLIFDWYSLARLGSCEKIDIGKGITDAITGILPRMILTVTIGGLNLWVGVVSVAILVAGWLEGGEAM